MPSYATCAKASDWPGLADAAGSGVLLPHRVVVALGADALEERRVVDVSLCRTAAIT